MSNQNLRIEAQSISQSAGISVSAANVSQTITATNNKAMYYAEQAKKYRDEAKNMRDLSQYYAEHNSDITQDYVDTIKTNLETKIAAKASTSEIPTKVSDLTNDSGYITNTYHDSAKQDILVSGTNIKTINSNSILGSGDLAIYSLPSQSGQSGKYLTTDGTDASWAEMSCSNTDLSNLTSTGENHFDNKYVNLSSVTAVLKTCYQNGTSGYNIWSNGYCEQWGIFPTQTFATVTTSLLKTFANTNYNIVTSGAGYAASTDGWCLASKTVSSFTSYGYNGTSMAGWRVCGYLAEGQY